MDYMIMEKLAEDFKKKYKMDFRGNLKALIRLNESIEKARKILSANTDTIITAESVMEDNDIHYNLTRKEFESIIDPLINDTLILCRKILNESKVQREEIHSVEMVGEASRIPIIIHKVQECIGAPTSRTMNSADCIARGCALQCAMEHSSMKVKDYSIKDFNPFPISIIHNMPGGEKKNVTLFKIGENFPIVKTLTFENMSILSAPPTI